MVCADRAGRLCLTLNVSGGRPAMANCHGRAAESDLNLAKQKQTLSTFEVERLESCPTALGHLQPAIITLKQEVGVEMPRH